MSTQYVEYTEEEVSSMLENAGFKTLELGKTKEKVYGRLATDDLYIVVFTSVSTGTTRGVGKDAGRVVLMTVDENIVWSGKRVHRTKGFLKNLLGRAREAWKWARVMPRCPKCGDLMAVRKNKTTGAEFFGCTRFPHCRGAVGLHEAYELAGVTKNEETEVVA